MVRTPRYGLQRATLAMVATLIMAHAAAQSPGPTPDPDQMPTSIPMPPAMMEDRAAQRFPQAVRVGDLVGRALLQPIESQPVIGHVLGVARQAGPEPGVVVRLDGGLLRPWLHWLGVGNRRVLVPVARLALLGEFVALIGYTPDQLWALPDYTEPVADRVDASEAIRIGLIAPFH